MLRITDLDQDRLMSWKTIRLELAGTREYPAGSAGRAFLLRLPLHEDGSICEAEFLKRPSRATVRRFWASEPDCSGRIVRGHDGWELSCSQHKDGEMAFRLAPQQIQPGGRVIMTAPDGEELPFRVASMTKLG